MSDNIAATVVNGIWCFGCTSSRSEGCGSFVRLLVKLGVNKQGLLRTGQTEQRLARKHVHDRGHQVQLRVVAKGESRTHKSSVDGKASATKLLGTPSCQT